MNRCLRRALAAGILSAGAWASRQEKEYGKAIGYFPSRLAARRALKRCGRPDLETAFLDRAEDPRYEVFSLTEAKALVGRMRKK